MEKVLETLLQMQALIKSAPELFGDGIDQELLYMIRYCIKLVNRK